MLGHSLLQHDNSRALCHQLAGRGQAAHPAANDDCIVVDVCGGVDLLGPGVLKPRIWEGHPAGCVSGPVHWLTCLPEGALSGAQAAPHGCAEVKQSSAGAGSGPKWHRCACEYKCVRSQLHAQSTCTHWSGAKMLWNTREGSQNYPKPPASQYRQKCVAHLFAVGLQTSLLGCTHLHRHGR